MKHFVLLSLATAMICGQSALAQRTVKNLYTESKTLQVEQVATAAETVQLNRYLFAGYNTLCLPLSLSGEQVAKTAPGLKVERLAAINQEGNTLCLYFVDCTAEGIEAGMPYLVFSPKTQYLRIKNSDATEVSTDIKTVQMTDAAGNRLSFSSSWEQRQKEGHYGIPAKQNVEVLESVLIPTTRETTFLPTRCEFCWEQQAPTATAIEIKHAANFSDVTAIKGMKNLGERVDIYDLKGNVVKKGVDAAQVKAELPAGVYIIDGEKVVIR